MKRFITSLCLTFALIMGFNTMASSQGFEAGKSYVYNEALPDTNYVMKLVIEIGRDGKTYKATIFSGKYKYNCPKGKVLRQEKLESVKCQNIVKEDAANFLLSRDELASSIQILQGSLKEPTRVITVYGLPPGPTSPNEMEFDKTYYFENPKVVHAELKGFSSDNLTIDAASVAGKTLYYNGEPGKNALIMIKVSDDGVTYNATIYSGQFKYKCNSAALDRDGGLEISECDPINKEDPNHETDVDPGPQQVSGSLTEIQREEIGTAPDAYQASGLRTLLYFSLDRTRTFGSTTNSKRSLQSDKMHAPVKPKMKRTPPRVTKDPLAQKLVTLKTLLKGGLITQKDYNTKRTAILKEMSGGKVDPIIQKLKRLKKLLDQKLISPADATYKRRQILDAM